MSTPSDPSSPDPEAGKEDSGALNAPASSTIGDGVRNLAPAWVWLCVFVAALAAGSIAWGVGERMHNYYGPSQEASRARFDFSALNREQGAADRKNAAIAFGTFGGLLGLLLGVCGGLTRRSASAALVAGLTGLLVGAIAGAMAGYTITPVFRRYYSDENPSLLLPLLVRSAVCAFVGLSAGLALGLGRRGPGGIPRGLLGGLIGSALGITAFELMIAFLFPMERNDKLIPTSMIMRLLFYVCVAIVAGAGSLVLERSQTRPSAHAPGGRI
jgi:hypothetical protein